MRYLRAAMDVQASDPDLPLIKGLFETFGRDESFVKDLKERGFPSCDRLIGYVDARQMEARDEIDAAYEAYSANSVLDAADRAYEMYIRKASATLTPVPASTPEPPENTPAPAAGSDASHTYKVGNQTRFTVGASTDEIDALCSQLFRDAQNWSENTAPRHLSDFPVMPDFLQELDDAATNAEFALVEESEGLVWHTSIYQPFQEWGLDYKYTSDGNTPLEFRVDGKGYQSVFLGDNLSKEDLYALNCKYHTNIDNCYYTIYVTYWLKGDDVPTSHHTNLQFDYNNDECRVVIWSIVPDCISVRITDWDEFDLELVYDKSSGDMSYYSQN